MRLIRKPGKQEAANDDGSTIAFESKSIL